jgi:hypothetical protein
VRIEITVILRYVLIVLTVGLLAIYFAPEAAYSQTQPSSTPTDFWSSLDTYAKVITGVVAAVVAILGLPVAFLQTRKTLAEVRKTELEAKKLQEQLRTETLTESQDNQIPESSDYQISVSNSKDTYIQILADPRLAAPLLLLLDFVVVYIELALIQYALDIFLPGILSRFILLSAGCFLFVPLLQEILRLRSVLRSDWDSTNRSKP